MEEAAARVRQAGRVYGALPYNLPAYTAHVLLVPSSGSKTDGLGLATPPPDLAGFLAQGPAPVYVGFGSIVLDDPARLYSAIIEAARRCRLGVIISRGWSKLGGDACNTADVFHLGDCPHGEYAPSKQSVMFTF